MRRARQKLLLIVLGPVVCTLWFVLGAQPAPRSFSFHFIDVGQGDATLVMDDAKRCVILIDSADTRYPDSSKNFRDYVSAQLPRGSEINLAVVSHPHNDHLGSMRWVLETYRVKIYVDNGQSYPSQIYKNLMSSVKQLGQQKLEYYPSTGVPREKEAVCGAGGPKIRVLHPKEGLDPNLCRQNANNCSVVMKVTMGARSFLFPGDAEEEQEGILLKDAAIRPQLPATVLKVPHHGSDTSSSQDFLDAVRPTVMVISAGQKEVGTNKGYKHPRLSTVQRLLGFAGPRESVRAIDVYDAEAKDWSRANIWGGIYITSRDRTVVLETDGTKISRK